MDTLYHYCPVSSFYSIIKNNSIWLSSLSLSNDYMEGRLVEEIFARMLKQSNFSDEDIVPVIEALKNLNEIFDGLGFCISEKPDLLSQWRGYADDGKGFSIGFSEKYFHSLTELNNHGYYECALYQVVYEQKDQEKLIMPIYENINNLIRSGKIIRPSKSLLITVDEAKRNYERYIESLEELQISIALVLSHLYQLKAKAFEEESEWRIISYLFRNDDKLNCRVLNNKLIPYREIKMIDVDENQDKIKIVYIGPKNITPIPVVEQFLEKNGFRDVEVIKSSASYR
jgi:hypothetical protein